MKTLKVFFVLFLILLEACNSTSTEPTIPPEVIVTVPFIEITTTATTADIKSTVNTNGATSIAVEYGVGNYNNSTNAVPASFSVNTVVNTKLTELIPSTKYQFRVKAVTGTKNVVQYITDSTFTTSGQLQIGDSYKKGIVIEVYTTNGVQHGLLAAPTDLTPTFGVRFNYFTAVDYAAKYGEGYRLPDSTEMKLVKKAKEAGVLTNFVDPNYDSRGIYFTSTEVIGSIDWVYIMEMYGNGVIKYILNKNSSASSRAVCSF